MIYHGRSLVGFMLWLRYGLLAGRPWRSLDETYARAPGEPGHEGLLPRPGPRAVRRVLRCPDHESSSVRETCYSALSASGTAGLLLDAARRLYPRWAVRRFLSGCGLYFLIEARRPAARSADGEEATRSRL